MAASQPLHLVLPRNMKYLPTGQLYAALWIIYYIVCASLKFLIWGLFLDWYSPVYLKRCLTSICWLLGHLIDKQFNEYISSKFSTLADDVVFIHWWLIWCYRKQINLKSWWLSELEMNFHYKNTLYIPKRNHMVNDSLKFY